MDYRRIPALLGTTRPSMNCVDIKTADGGWTDRSHTRGPISTAFALLFLIRSTQKTIFTAELGSSAGRLWAAQGHDRHSR